MTHIIKETVSWGGTGLFTADGDDVTDSLRPEFGVSASRGMELIRQFVPPRVGGHSFRLSNIDQVYSPGNVTSDRYGQVVPGKKVRLSTLAVSALPFEFMDGSDFDFLDGSPFESFPIPAINIWTGLTETFRHNPAWGELSVDVSCLQMMSRLVGKEISTALYQDILINDAIDVLLDTCNWPAADRELDTATVTLDNWWLTKEDAFRALVDLVSTEGAKARFYEDGSGKIVFKNNTARDTEDVSTASQVTFDDLDPSGNVTVEEFNDNSNSKVLAVSIEQHERELQPLSVIWSRGSDIVLAANETLTIEIQTSDPFQNEQTPTPYGTNEEQTLTPTTVLTSGIFNLFFNTSDTGGLNYNSTAADIQSGLDAILGAGSVICSGGPINIAPVVVEFRGTFKEAKQPLLTSTSLLNPASSPAQLKAKETTVIDVGIDQVITLYRSDDFTAGTFTLTFGSFGTSPTILFSATAGNVQTALNNMALFNSGDVSCSGGPVNTADVNITVSNAQTTTPPVPVPTVNASGLLASRPTASINITETVVGGGPDYTVTAGSVSITLSDVKAQSLKVNLAAGASGATITGLQLRAQLLTIVRTNIATYPSSVSLPDGQIYKPTIRPDISLSVAQSLVQDVYNRYYVSHPTETITRVTQIGTADFYAVLLYDIGWRVTVKARQNMIDEDFWIEQMEHVIDWNNNLMISRFGSERIA